MPRLIAKLASGGSVISTLVNNPLRYIASKRYGPVFRKRKEAFNPLVLREIFTILKQFFLGDVTDFTRPDRIYIREVRQELRAALPLYKLAADTEVVRLIIPSIHKILVENCAEARSIPNLKEGDIFPLLLLYLTHEGNPVFGSSRLKVNNLHKLSTIEEILLELKRFQASELKAEGLRTKRPSEPSAQVNTSDLETSASHSLSTASSYAELPSGSESESIAENNLQPSVDSVNNTPELLLSGSNTTAEVEANVKPGIESLLEELEDLPANPGLPPTGEGSLNRTSETDSSLVPYPSSTPTTTPSERSPEESELQLKIKEGDTSLTEEITETSTMPAEDCDDTKLYGVVVDKTTSNFTTSNWLPLAKFESTEADHIPIRIGAPNAEIKDSWGAREFPTAQLVAMADEYHHLEGHVDFMLSDINTAMVICRKHQGAVNHLPKQKLSDDERGNPNSQKVKDIKSYKNEYSRLTMLREAINHSATSLSQWLTFDSRPPLDAWLNAYMGIIKSTCEKMVKELRDIDENLPRTSAGEPTDGISSMMATLDLQDRSNRGIDYKLSSNGRGIFSVKMPIFKGNPLEYKKWKRELDDLFLNAYKRGASNFSPPIVWGLIFDALDKDLFHQWKDVYDKTDEGIDKLLKKLEKRYNNVYQLGLMYKGELKNVPSPKDDDLESLEQLIHQLSRIEKGLIDAGTHIDHNSQELLLHLMPKISKKAPKLYADWLSRQQIVVHQTDDDGSSKSIDGIRLKNEYKEFKRFLNDRSDKLSTLDLQKRLYATNYDNNNTHGSKRNNGRNFAGQVHSAEDTGESLKRKRESDSRDPNWAGNVANKRPKRPIRSDHPRDRLGRKDKDLRPRFKKEVSRRSTYNVDARTIINRTQAKGRFVKTCPFHRSQNQSGHSPIECQNLNDNAFKDKKQLVWAILHKNGFCVGCLKKHDGKCKNIQKCDMFENGKHCHHIHHRKLHFAQEQYLTKKRYLDKPAYYDTQIENYFRK